jgi:hypothetical protein
MWMITVTFYGANAKYINMSEYIKQSLHMAEDTAVVLSASSHTKGRHNILIQPAAIWIMAVKEIELCFISVVRFNFEAHSQNYEKRLLVWSHLSVHMEQLGSHCCMDFHDI